MSTNELTKAIEKARIISITIVTSYVNPTFINHQISKRQAIRLITEIDPALARFTDKEESYLYLGTIRLKEYNRLFPPVE